MARKRVHSIFDRAGEPPEVQGPPAWLPLTLLGALLLLILLIVLTVRGCSAAVQLEPGEWLDADGLRAWLRDLDEHPAGLTVAARNRNKMLQAAAAERGVAWLKVTVRVPAGESWLLNAPAPAVVRSVCRGVPADWPALGLLLGRDELLNRWEDSRQGRLVVRAPIERGEQFRALLACPLAQLGSRVEAVTVDPQAWSVTR